MADVTYKIHGMDCTEEVAILKKALAPLGLDEEHLAFNPLQGRLSINNFADLTTTSDIETAINKTGMRAEEWDKLSENVEQQEQTYKKAAEKYLWLSSAIIIGIAITQYFWFGGTLHNLLEPDEPLNISTAMLLFFSMLHPASTILPKAWTALRYLKPDINLLVTIAVIGAIGLGNLFEAAMVAFLFSIALKLESWSVQRANNAIQTLLDLAPQQARWIRTTDCGCTDEIEAPISDIPLGATLRILPGERIPLDGTITQGHSSINQATITGESTPIDKGPGDTVFAGTINNESALEITTTTLADDTQLAKIIHSVEDAQAQRAPVEQWIDRFARYYTPAMMALALLIAIGEPFILSTPWQDAIYHALVLLLIACPCALVISTPVSIVAGLASAARAGVLIKGGIHLESAARINAIAFDKTGTLTTGKPTVQKIYPLNGHTESEMLTCAAAIEQLSDHPLAQAIVSHAADQGITPSPASACTQIQGLGAEATINDTTYWIGSHRLLLDKAPEDATANQHAEALEDAGHSIVMIGNTHHVCGLISIADTLKEEAKPTLEQLEALGIKQRIMLTGDNQGTAKAIASALPLTHCHSELLPQDKSDIIATLTAENDTYVAMIGDGVNDAPALARSDLAIAMGAAGSDTAIETADIALMADDLSKVPWLINHARNTLCIIKQNVVFALGLKLVVLLLAFFGIASLWLAILADMGGSLMVTTNALRLLRAKSS